MHAPAGAQLPLGLQVILSHPIWGPGAQLRAFARVLKAGASLLPCLARLLCRHWGSELRSASMYCRHFTDRAVFPAPFPQEFFKALFIKAKREQIEEKQAVRFCEDRDQSLVSVVSHVGEVLSLNPGGSNSPIQLSSDTLWRRFQGRCLCFLMV